MGILKSSSSGAQDGDVNKEKACKNALYSLDLLNKVDRKEI